MEFASIYLLRNVVFMIEHFLPNLIKTTIVKNDKFLGPPPPKTVLRIKIILMRIRIFDPEWKKIDLDPDPDPGYFFKIYWIFFNKAKFSIFCLIFMLKLNEPFWNKEIFIIFLFFNSSDLGFESVLFFIFFAVFGWYFAPWMRIFLLKSCGARSNGSGSKALKKKVR